MVFECFESSISLRHLWHRFSSRSARHLVSFIIVGRVDKVWTHLTLFLILNPQSDHSQPLGCSVNIIVLIVFPLLIFGRFSNLFYSHVVFLLLPCKLCSGRPSRYSSFIRSISDTMPGTNTFFFTSIPTWLIQVGRYNILSNFTITSLFLPVWYHTSEFFYMLKSLINSRFVECNI